MRGSHITGYMTPWSQKNRVQGSLGFTKNAIAFVVGRTIGLITGGASADYIHLYHGNVALLKDTHILMLKSALPK
jgi:hypothetical protein